MGPIPALSFPPDPDDAGTRLLKLREVLALVEEIACLPASRRGNGEAEASAMQAAWDRAPPIARLLHDRLAAATAAQAAAGVEALLASVDAGRPAAAAAARLAALLGVALDRMGRPLGLNQPFGWDASAAAKSAIRSSGSSRPTCSRTSGPSASHGVAVRKRAGSTGTARLSYPPQL